MKTLPPRPEWLRYNRAARKATEERPDGERHLVGVVEPGPHGLALATVAVMIARPVTPRAVGDVERLSFETFDEARAFVTAWIWYRVGKREARP